MPKINEVVLAVPPGYSGDYRDDPRISRVEVDESVDSPVIRYRERRYELPENPVDRNKIDKKSHDAVEAALVEYEDAVAEQEEAADDSERIAALTKQTTALEKAVSHMWETVSGNAKGSSGKNGNGNGGGGN